MRDYLRLLWPLFVFLTAVWFLRLILSGVGCPLTMTRFFSVTAAGALAVFLSVLLIHARRFGGYTSVVVASLLLNAWSQILIVLAIIFSVVTGTVNVYTLPEFSGKGPDPLHLRHIIGHLTFAVGLGTLFGAGMGCLLLWLMRIMVPTDHAERGRTK
jgi:lysylphosphatidylglycerol synthetase-like protein (DUF2156 family)